MRALLTAVETGTSMSGGASSSSSSSSAGMMVAGECVGEPKGVHRPGSPAVRADRGRVWKKSGWSVGSGRGGDCRVSRPDFF